MYKKNIDPRVQGIHLQINEIDRVSLNLEKQIEEKELELDILSDHLSDIEESKIRLEFELEEINEK